MQVQVHTDDHIQGGESLARWISEETAAKLARFRDQVTRVEVFLTDVDESPWGEPRLFGSFLDQLHR